MTDTIYKYPRLYLKTTFSENQKISLSSDQLHYLRNVLRQKNGDRLRVFNGSDGEWSAVLENIGKRSGDIILDKCFRSQKLRSQSVHLFFSPLKKNRMDFLIEKSVELGVSDFHPVLMRRTENRKINAERMVAQIIEASEQCERMDIPMLHDVVSFDDIMACTFNFPLYACVERGGLSALSSYDVSGSCGFLIGPEGGFDPSEADMMDLTKSVCPVDLGEEILRAETAALSCLSYAKFSNVL